ncbi:Spy/CpxP family protein refolding chaperone [Bradyrhizobium sp. USDA 4369]
MKKLALALASLTALALAAPSMASAETVIIKRGGHHYHHGWDRGHGGWDRSRAEYRMHRDIRPYHRHHDRTVIIRRGY